MFFSHKIKSRHTFTFEMWNKDSIYTPLIAAIKLSSNLVSDSIKISNASAIKDDKTSTYILATYLVISRNKLKSFSPIPPCIWSPNLAGLWLTLRGTHKVTWPFDHMVLRYRDGSKTLYLHHYNPWSY